ncbi:MULTISPECIES: DUF4268 domain-containing protein [unclassified Moraxella]|uniref:DUF4268 domain-containing protein n=1 Tax=unclassified Moraxella TaxID=2685852 RepID=UPI003AF739F1
MALGRLEKLDLRDYWQKEATDFTPWLAKNENIQLLSEVIGIELEVLSQEEKVGAFSADILCRDTINDHYVLIENQLERTDHTHLGQLMTYAAGLDAVTIIWIAQKFTEEHRAALDWLNRITDETFNFFGIEIELYKIGDSLPAPMFNMISQPNDWAKFIKKTTSNQMVTETKILQQQYWQAVKDYFESTNSPIRMQNPLPQHWTNIAIGRSYFNISFTVSSRDNSLGIWLNIMGNNAKENFDRLAEVAQAKSYEAVDKNLIWDRLNNRKGCVVTLKTNGDFLNIADRPNQFEWFKVNAEKFIHFFKPYILEL